MKIYSLTLYIEDWLKGLCEYHPTHRYQKWLWDFFLFGIKQAWACLFGGGMIFLIIASKYLWPDNAAIARYDFLFMAAVSLQALLILARLETMEEVKVIFIFHLVGTIMEIFKTAHGSWSYPEESFFCISGVPLFSGFMYASVGSYIARATRIFNLQYRDYPAHWAVGAMALAIYINFFTHHYMPDIRDFIFLLVGAFFGRTQVYFTPGQREYHMPLLVGFCLIAFFIWLGENVGTYTRTWLYPTQQAGWKPVGFGKFGSWFLLVIISFALVSFVHRPQRNEAFS
jgi:uncharacterized membrane protein YoaT (DUF817 family)